MKQGSLLLLIAGVLVGLNSCTKDSSKSDSITGKWQLIEMYNGYANGGDFLWHTVAFENAHTLQFSANGQYVKQEKRNGTLQQCSGTYHFLTSDIVEINSSCQLTVEKTKISKLTNGIMIFDYPVIEGKIRYKYAAEK